MRTTDREKKALTALAKVNNQQAAISSTFPSGTCFICGDADDVAWYRELASGCESITCRDCRQIQKSMFGTVFVKVGE